MSPSCLNDFICLKQNKVTKISISKFVFWTSRNMYFAQNEAVREEGRFWQKEIFIQKEPFVELLPVLNSFKMSFYKIWQ